MFVILTAQEVSKIEKKETHGGESLILSK